MSLVVQYVPTFMVCQLQPVQPPNYIYLCPYLSTPTCISIHIYVLVYLYLESFSMYPYCQISISISIP